MTSHHDVAGLCERLRVNTCRYADETEEAAAKRRIATDLAAADLLESQAKALSEAEAERNRIKAFLSEGDWQTIESEQAWRRRALAAEARLAEFKTEATKVIDELAADLRAEIEGRYAGIKHYPSEARRYARDIAPVVAARAFTNAAKEKTDAMG